MIGCRTACFRQTRTPPLCGFCRQRVRTESRHPKSPTFSISVLKLDSLKTIFRSRAWPFGWDQGRSVLEREEIDITVHRSTERPLRAASSRLRIRFLPTHGWGKQSVWLAASGLQRSFRAEARTHFAARGRRQREENRFCDCRDCDAVDKEKLPWAKQGEDRHDHNPCMAV